MGNLWKPLVICWDYSAEGVKNGFNHPCGFADLITLVGNVIADLVILGTMATVIICMWAGLKLITAGMRGDSGAMKDARGMFMNVLKGYIIMLVAWLVVYTIMSVLVDPSYSLLK